MFWKMVRRTTRSRCFLWQQTHVPRLVVFELLPLSAVVGHRPSSPSLTNLPWLGWAGQDAPLLDCLSCFGRSLNSRFGLDGFEQLLLVWLQMLGGFELEQEMLAFVHWRG